MIACGYTPEQVADLTIRQRLAIHEVYRRMNTPKK